MNIAFLNPSLVYQAKDPFTTGIVYAPIGLANFVAVVRRVGHQCQVLDSFGLAPNNFEQKGRFVFRGLTPDKLVEKIHAETKAICLYAINAANHESTLAILKKAKMLFPELPILVLENTQAVTSYSLRHVLKDFFDSGASFVVTGESEERALFLLSLIEKGEPIGRLEGIAQIEDGKIQYSPPEKKIENLDQLPFPAWDLFPIQNYWKLGYAHGPLTSKRYLPILTSRGCPYPCKFCVIPELNDTKWRARSAKSVVDEMEHFQKTLGVSEFHVEDVDPTVNDARTQSLCQEILSRKLKVSWKLCSGTKVETIKSEETVALMAKAGCTYVSISPESGSEELVKKMGKPFNYKHAVKMIHAMKRSGIRTQACFVLGFPGETDEDRALTRKMVHELTKEGLDEIAQFIITPVPGSAIHSQFNGYQSISDLIFSPTWREDYEKLNSFRVRLYRDFLLWKLRYHPLVLLKQPFQFLSRRFETKMEMTPYRVLQMTFRARLSRSS
jgi:anaerobic magnesium-protoporphyrin IX monomethyl ester cyclase